MGEIDALCQLTGLSPKRYNLIDQEIGMEWYDQIIPQIVVKDRLYYDNKRIMETNYERLLFAGFSKEFIDSLNVDVNSKWFTFSEIIRVFMEYATRKATNYHPFVSIKGFPKLSDNEINLIGQWDKPVSLGVPYLFHVGPIIDSTIQRDMALYLKLEPTASFHFHETSWENAIDVSNYGIRRCTLNNQFTDFGYKCFTVLNNIEVALQYSENISIGYRALLCYHIENLENVTIKRYETPDEVWQNTVYDFRSYNNYFNRPHRICYDNGDGYDIIEGPMCSLSTDYINDKDDITCVKHNGNVVIQTAFRNETSCLELDEKMVGVIFFSSATYQYEHYKERMDVHREELIKKVFHPRRFSRYLEMGYNIFDEIYS